ncbi:MAG: ester cyclase [Phenylobacterium sp.]|uniref:ester cyclase n=1 Tax=Phenylobacterium sp. TaxID=1871053 RepID=UPI001A21303E|nr:ester cyclase [Phenylobacterium sp.]MBJ7411849.1 ester cyclase [Phenylobacterium sp.]
MTRLATVAVAAATLLPLPAAAQTPESVVRGFFRDVRSGARPEWADHYFAPLVTAHQVTSEGETQVIRTPGAYASHVREFLDLFGEFRLELVEVLASGDRVYVRWRQTGRHLASLDGEVPTGAHLVDLASAVYRVRRGRIVEYWIQSDRKGLELQVGQAVARRAAGS